MQAFPEHIAELIRNGRKVEAIKLLREETGVDLQTAKEAVDRLDADPAFDPIPEQEWTGGIPEVVKSLAWKGQKIAAIKVFRDHAGLDLNASKEIVEQLPRDPNLPAPNVRSAVVSMLIAIFLLGMGLAMVIYFLNA